MIPMFKLANMVGWAVFEKSFAPLFCAENGRPSKPIRLMVGLHSLHEQDVLCISKGKDHKKYEFGNKVSLVRLWNGVIIGAMAFRNEYDGHTIDGAKEQVSRHFTCQSTL